MLIIFDHRRHLFLGQAVPLDHGRVVRRHEPGRFSQARQYGRSDWQVLNSRPGRFDPHQIAGNFRGDRKLRREGHFIGSFSVVATSVIMPLNCRKK